MKKLITARQINKRIKELGKELSTDYNGLDPIFIGILKGSFVFLAHLMKHLDCSPEVDFMEVSSYGAERKSSGTIRILKDLEDHEIRGRNVIVVEDVLDSGLTLNFLVETLMVRQPKSLEICVLVEKDIPGRISQVHKPKYVGFTVPNKFIVGFGMDEAEKYRELPYIGYID